MFQGKGRRNFFDARADGKNNNHEDDEAKEEFNPANGSVFYKVQYPFFRHDVSLPVPLVCL